MLSWHSLHLVCFLPSVFSIFKEKNSENIWQLHSCMASLLCIITAMVVAFPSWSAEAVLRWQQYHRLKFTYLYYSRCWKCSPLVLDTFPTTSEQILAHTLSLFLRYYTSEFFLHMWISSQTSVFSITTDWKYQLQKLSLANQSLGCRECITVVL
jgi:hypothetical protein